MMNLNIQQKLHYTLRLAVAMCFIGHGSFGIITKEIWCNYFAVFGINKSLAYQLMPWLGGLDIAFGIIMLIYPMRVIPLWLAAWGIVTAMLRPLSGEPFAEFIERAGNFGAPLALLILSGGVNFENLFKPINPNTETPANLLPKAINCLKVVVFLLLAGHGWLNLIEKKGLIEQYASFGFSNPVIAAHVVGAFEVAAAASVLIKPIRPVILLFFVWKMASELFYPHWEAFEWIERGGSYGCLLALWFALGKKRDLLQSVNNLRTA
ncbi:MAG: hypothetical protein ACTHMI_17860 [Mucilaginibacter sp.]